MQRRITKRQQKNDDALRLRSILDILVMPFSDPEYDHLHIEDKLYLAFSQSKTEVYRRKLKKPVNIYGLWWLDEDQLTRWDWQGPGSQIFHESLGVSKILTSRLFFPNVRNTYCYIREDKDLVDVEIMVRAKVGGKFIREWLTCTVTLDEYKKLDECFGPRESVCCKNYHNGDC